MESNEAVAAILEVLCIFASSFDSKIVVESNLKNAISWVASYTLLPWGFQFYFNEIKELSSKLSVEFQHVGRSANGFANALAKQGVDILAPFIACSL